VCSNHRPNSIWNVNKTRFWNWFGNLVQLCCSSHAHLGQSAPRLPLDVCCSVSGPTGRHTHRATAQTESRQRSGPWPKKRLAGSLPPRTNSRAARLLIIPSVLLRDSLPAPLLTRCQRYCREAPQAARLHSCDCVGRGPYVNKRRRLKVCFNFKRRLIAAERQRLRCFARNT